MTTKIRIEFNSEGFKELLQSEGMRKLVSDNAKAIQQRAGGDEAGYSEHEYMGGYGQGRWVGTVEAATEEARRDEAENKTLTKAVTG